MRILLLGLISLGLWGQVQPGRPVLYDSNGNVSVGNTVLVPLVCDGSTDNASRIQSALSLYLNPHLTGSGNCMISTALVVGSNTHLSIEPTVHLKRVSNAAANMLVNLAYSTWAITSSVSLAWTSGTVVTATWTGHGRSVGDYVLIAGASPSVFNGVFRIASVVDANTITYNAMYVPGTTPTGTVTAKLCDTNIVIEGGVWDQNPPVGGGPSLTTNHGIILAGAQNVSLRNLTFVHGWTYPINIGAVSDLEIDNLDVTCTENCSTVKGYGPIFNSRFKNTHGIVSDDGISLQTKEADPWASLRFTWGDILNSTIDGMNVQSTSANSGLVVLYPSTNERMDGIVVRNIQGQSYTAPVISITTNGYASAVLGMVKIENITASGDQGVSVWGVNTGSVIINSLDIANMALNLRPNTTTNLVEINPTATVRKLTLNGISVDNTGWGSSAAYVLEIGGTVNETVVRDSVVNGGASGRLFHALGTAVVRSLIFDGVTQQTGDIFSVWDASIAGNPTIQLRGCDVKGPSSIVNISCSASVLLFGNKFENAYNGVIRTATTQTLDVRGHANMYVGSTTFLAVPSGTPAVSIKDWNAPVDLSLTGVTRASGNYAYNTNAALGTLGAAGMVVCQGTSANSWHLLATPTLVY